MINNPGTGNTTPSNPDAVTAAIGRATSGWNELLAAIDRDEENERHVLQLTRDVFFSVRDALLAAEDHDETADQAKRLFNLVVRDLYVLEPVADDAAELEPQRWQGGARLSDLFCSGVARMFDGQPRVTPQPAPADAQDEFVTIGTLLSQSAAVAAALTPAALAKRLAAIDWWYVKWSAQRLRVAVNEKTGDLHASVFEADSPSPHMNGWQLRLGRQATATIANATATLKLPPKLDPATLTLQIRDPKGDWTDLFARVSA